MSIRRSTGSARRGLGEWLLQRFSAVYIGGFVVYILLRLLVAPITDYADWRHWLQGASVRVFATLFFGSIAIHAWLGMRSVYMDYLHFVWLRLTVAFLTAGGLLALFVWSVDVLWKVTA